jgi:hypothetical protein
LRAFTKVSPLRRAGLWGFSLEASQTPGGVGFFVGFLTDKPSRTTGLASASLQPPECVALAYVRPAGGSLRRRLVSRPTSLFRRSFELLTKYTARPPRFQFQENSSAVLARHIPLSTFPSGEREKYARNFFRESLALIVRSGFPSGEREKYARNFFRESLALIVRSGLSRELLRTGTGKH